ncbi:MAG TPA: type II toxin-antitoxin system VapC family toxin [Pirellulales bacterium]|nr:type II toxin-antitoxin system VapC family toxin [Pirellulales bacterium]
MKYILDASVALKWVLKEPGSDRARRLRDEFRNRAHEFLAPESFLPEVGHALTRAERKGLIQPPMASAFFADILSTAPEIHSLIPLMPKAVDLSSASRLGVYDCLYVIMAEREGCELLTADERLVTVFKGHPVVSLDSL